MILDLQHQHFSKPRQIVRAPYRPAVGDWAAEYDMLCGHCEHQLKCSIVDAMIEMKDGGPWPRGGWVSDPGAGVTCLSYQTRSLRPMPRQQRRAIERLPESALPPVCGGCAARKGSEASVSLHTQRDFAVAVQTRAKFLCHETLGREQLCGGWCRAIRARSGK